MQHYTDQYCKILVIYCAIAVVIVNLFPYCVFLNHYIHGISQFYFEFRGRYKTILRYYSISFCVQFCINKAYIIFINRITKQFLLYISFNINIQRIKYNQIDSYYLYACFRSMEH